MDSLQFYEGPPKKKSLAKRRKRVLPLYCEIDGKENQVAKPPTASENGTDEAQLQFDTLRIVCAEEAGNATLIPYLDVFFSNSTGSLGLQTVTNDPVSSISDFASKTAACNELSGEASIEIGRSLGVDSYSERSDVPIEPPACELATSHTIKDPNRSKQNHDYVGTLTEKPTLSVDAKDTESLISRSRITSPCHESNHPLLSRPIVAPCEACTFKDGQIFALVQILHSFHRGRLQTHAAGIAPESQKRLSKGRSASISVPNRIRTAAQAGGAKAYQSAARSYQASQKTEKERIFRPHVKRNHTQGPALVLVG